MRGLSLDGKKKSCLTYARMFGLANLPFSFFNLQKLQLDTTLHVKGKCILHVDMRAAGPSRNIRSARPLCGDDGTAAEK